MSKLLRCLITLGEEAEKDMARECHRYQEHR